MKTLAQKIEVMQAAMDGKEIEIMNITRDNGWEPLRNPALSPFSWGAFDYRIKGEPVQWWSNMYAGIVEDLRFPTKQTALDAAGNDVQNTILMRQVKK